MVFLLNLEYTEDMAIHNSGESSSELLYFSRRLIVNPVLWGIFEFQNLSKYAIYFHAILTLGEVCFHLPFTQDHFCEMLLMKL